MIRCLSCSTKNNEGNKFCIECGAELLARKKEKQSSGVKQKHNDSGGRTLVLLLKVSIFLEVISLLVFGACLFLYNDLLLEQRANDTTYKFYGFLKYAQFSIPFAVFIFFGLVGIISAIVYMKKQHAINKVMLLMFVFNGFCFAFVPGIGPVFALIFGYLLIKNKGLPEALVTRGDPHIALAKNTYNMSPRQVIGKPAIYTAILYFITAFWQPVSFVASHSQELGFSVERIKSLTGDEDYFETVLKDRQTFTTGKRVIKGSSNFYSIDITKNAIVKFYSCYNEFYSIDIQDSAEVSFAGGKNAFYIIRLSGTAKAEFNNCTLTHGYSSNTTGRIVVDDFAKVLIEDCTIPSDGDISIQLQSNSEVVLRNCTIPLSRIEISNNSTLVLDNVTFTDSGKDDWDYSRKPLIIKNESVVILKNTPVVSKIILEENATIAQFNKSFKKTKSSNINGIVVTIKPEDHNLSFTKIAEKCRK